MKTIVVSNNKGGVGKTTVATQIAHSLAADGNSVVCIDLDGQRNMSASLENMKELGSALALVADGEAPEIDLASGEIGLIKGHVDLIEQNDEEVMSRLSTAMRSIDGVDFCVVDTPPSFSVVVYGALLGADYLLVPIEMKRYSIEGLEGVLSAFMSVKDVNEGLELLGFVPSRFDAVKAQERATLAEVIEQFSEVMVPHAFRNRVAYEEAQANGIPLAEVKNKSGKEAAKEFAEFMEWLKGRIY
ncbi:ParA family protein [Roseobacter weihaiensis]|uniref:ParA family protein n=1 Tax=Roseobacter weihaiensis TaxID=2763262 RepID=UPI001D09AB2F|nr:ParA family protein [Roseobacter sp. H9]